MNDSLQGMSASDNVWTEEFAARLIVLQLPVFFLSFFFLLNFTLFYFGGEIAGTEGRCEENKCSGEHDIKDTQNK